MFDLGIKKIYDPRAVKGEDICKPLNSNEVFEEE